MDQALQYMSAARAKEGKEFTLPSTEITNELIYKIKQRQTKAGKLSSEQRMKDEEEKNRLIKYNLNKIKLGDLS